MKPLALGWGRDPRRSEPTGPPVMLPRPESVLIDCCEDSVDEGASMGVLFPGRGGGCRGWNKEYGCGEGCTAGSRWLVSPSLVGVVKDLWVGVAASLQVGVIDPLLVGVTDSLLVGVIDSLLEGVARFMGGP